MKNFKDINVKEVKEDDSPVHPRQNILLDLMYKKELSFNQLWRKQGRSNNFAYHVKKLEEEGFIKKVNGKFKLTIKGKKRVAYLESMTGNRLEQPITAVIMVIQEKDKILMLNRTKEPFHGYWGVHGGKLKSTNYILKQAEESILEETGLTCQLELKGLFSSRSYLNEELSYGHQLFVVKASKPKGKLLEKTKKGQNKWFKKTEIKKLHILPSVKHLLEIVESKHFRWIEADRFQEDIIEDQFKRTKVLRNETI
jgi:ADP-ribose pyrophosphatase YjhB (NUDIX family)